MAIEVIKTRACAECGRVFTPASSRQKYCKNPDCPKGRESLDWAEKYKKKKGLPVLNGEFVARCEMCGKQFTTPTLRVKFCSETCKRIRTNYLNRVQYAKRNNLPAPIDPADMLKRKTATAERRAATIAARKAREEQVAETPTYTSTYTNIERRPMDNTKRHYSPEELEKKLDAKSRRIVITVRALEDAGLDDNAIFEAVKSITRMPLNKF